ncbi:N-acetylneuraminate synthase family protein [Flavobacteriaceae bacterium]|nr:N-acetylneuraminate synthase family protein [Flavobacteriaceae bacterium]
MVIVEIGQAHNGSLGRVHAFIDAIAITGADIIKFQTHIAEAESSIHEPFRVQFSSQDASRMNYWKRMEFSLRQWKEIKSHCDDVGLEFMSSPFSSAAVDLLEEVGVERYKIGSGEVSNFLLLDKIVKTNKPLIISSGMSSFQELDDTVNFLKSKKASFSLMQCTTEYPTQPKKYGLNVIQEMKERYSVAIGYSDHSADIGTCIAATVLGADFLEVHAVFDKREFGPDVSSSLTIDEISILVESVRKIEVSINNPVDKNDIASFEKVKNIFEKSLAVNKDLKSGHILSIDDLESKKPKGFGINAKDYQTVIGKSINRDMSKWNFLNYKDINE